MTFIYWYNASIHGQTQVDDLIEGVIPHLVDGGLSILQYANDTILFMEHDLEKARNLKLTISASEQVSGLKINFIRVSCFVFVRLKTRSLHTPTCLSLGSDNFL
jgi:hypothetical protein